MTLYELTVDYMSLLEMAEDPDIDQEALRDTMEGIEGAIEDKADAYAVVIAQLSTDAQALDAEIKRLTARKKSLENNAAYIKKSLQGALEAVGKQKLKTLRYTFTIAKNGGKAPLIMHVTADELPDNLVKIKREVDTDRIRVLLDAGKGAEWAEYGDRGTSLRIK